MAGAGWIGDDTREGHLHLGDEMSLGPALYFEVDFGRFSRQQISIE